MAIDEEDLKAISKMVNTAISDRLDRAEKKQAEALAKVIEEAVGSKLAEATKAKAAEADKAAPIEEERRTNKQRIEALEASIKAKDDALQAQTMSGAFRKAWSGPAVKFIPELGEDHLAVLQQSKRLKLDEDGQTVRVIDPKKSQHETHPTVEEYVAELAKSDRGKFYQGARTSAGQGATAANGGATGPKQHIPNAVMGLVTGNFSE